MEKTQILSPLTFLFLLFCLILILNSNAQNLICNGNISGFTLTGFNDGQYRQDYPSNFSCWFNKNGGTIQVKNKVQPPMGMAIQLVTTAPYVLCQKITLQQNQIYSLSFTVGNCKDMTYSTVTATFNNIFIMNLTVTGELKIGTGVKIFKWTSNTTANLCFSSKFLILNLFYIFNGPTINNVILVKLSTSANSSSTNSSSTNSSPNSSFPNFSYTSNSSIISPQVSVITIDANQSLNYSTIQDSANYPLQQKQINVYCHTKNENIYSEILIVCNFTSLLFYQTLKKLSKDLELFFQGELQTEFQVDNILPNSFELTVFPKRSYKLTNISIFLSESIDAKAANQYIRFKFFINNQPITFTILTQEEVKLMKTIYPLAQNVIGQTFNIYKAMKSSFVSYFLTDLISFWNLSLMYNLLNISTVPLFLKYFFENLSYQFFILNDIIEWISEKIPQLKQRLDFSGTLGPERMAQFKNNYAWFGSFGMSSGFLTNNLQNIIMIGVLLLKLIFLRYLRKIIGRVCGCLGKMLRLKLQKNMPHKNQIKVIFVEQLFLFSIFMAVSGGTSILETGFLLWKQKINYALQSAVIWLILMLYPLFMIMNVKMRNQKMERSLRQKLRSKSQNNRSIFFKQKISKTKQIKSRKITIESFYNVLEYLPYTLIPSFILIDSPMMFLIVMTVVIWLKSWYYIKHRQKFSSHKNLRDRVFTALSLFIWFIHHHVYVIYFAVEKFFLRNESGLNQTTILSFLKYCGFTSIFTVLVGGVLEILSFLLMLIGKLISVLKFIFKMCKKEEKKMENLSEQPKQMEEQQNKKQINSIHPLNEDVKSIKIVMKINTKQKKELNNSKEMQNSRKMNNKQMNMNISKQMENRKYMENSRQISKQTEVEEYLEEKYKKRNKILHRQQNGKVHSRFQSY